MYTIYTLFYNTLVYHILCNAITIGVILNRFPNLGNITPVNSMQQYLMKQNSPKASRVLVEERREMEMEGYSSFDATFSLTHSPSHTSDLESSLGL